MAQRNLQIPVTDFDGQALALDSRGGLIPFIDGSVSTPKVLTYGAIVVDQLIKVPREGESGERKLADFELARKVREGAGDFTLDELARIKEISGQLSTFVYAPLVAILEGN